MNATFSDSIKAIAAALSKAQHDIGPVVKNYTMKIPGRGDYKYAGLDDVYEAVDKIAHENGLALVCRPDGDALHSVLLHNSGEWIDYGRYPLGSASKHQERGSALTYARRYVTQCVYQIAAQDDDDGTLGNDTLAVKTPLPPRAAPKVATVGTVATIPPNVAVSTTAKPLAPSLATKEGSPFNNRFERETWVIMYIGAMDSCLTLDALTDERNRRKSFVEKMKASQDDGDIAALDQIAEHYAKTVARINANPVIIDDEIPY